MIDFFIEGGWGMWPVLVTGLVLVWAGGRYALDAEPVRPRFIAVLSLAHLALAFQALATNIATVFKALQDPNAYPDAILPRVLAAGLKESSRPMAEGSPHFVMA